MDGGGCYYMCGRVPAVTEAFSFKAYYFQC